MSAPHEPLPFGDLEIADRYSVGFYDQFPQLYAVYAQDHATPLVAHFAFSACERFGAGHPQSGLDIGCGPGHFAVDLARLGVTMTAMDLSGGMLDYARQHAEQCGVSIAFEQGNMLDYRAPTPVDLAINLGENLSYVMTHAEMQRHLHAVADSLVEGGIYICQLSLPIYHWATYQCTFDPPWLVFSGLEPMPSEAVVNGVRVILDFHGETVRFDPIRQIFTTHLQVTIVQPDGSARRLTHNEVHRVFFPQEFRALVDQCGRFDFCGWYADFALQAPLESHPETGGYVVVLKRSA